MTKSARGLAASGAALFLLGFGLQRLAAPVPGWVERVYSRGLFPAIARGLSWIAAPLPFSLAEVLVGLAAVLALAWLLTAMRAIAREPRGGRWPVVRRQLAGLLAVFGALYLGFILLWGLNYDRRPLAASIGLETRPASVTELAALCSDLIDRTNALRRNVQEDSAGVMRVDDSIAGALRRAPLGYDRAAASYPVLAGRYSRPKGVAISALWSYTGISGVYFPFTGEANVNIAQPDSSIPATASHEMAHQRGFAREDEANFIAYLTCGLHPDADFRYSGSLLALETAMDALRQLDSETYAQLAARYSNGVRRDIAREDAFWSSHRGPVERFSNRVNDQYLKANLQSEGVGSYGRMVDLLLAEYRVRQGT